MIKQALSLIGIHLRSIHWAAVRRVHLHHEPRCQWCCGTEGLEAHHIIPFSVNRRRELLPENLITLCDGPNRCHFRYGHLGNWKKFNPMIRTDCKARNTLVS